MAMVLPEDVFSGHFPLLADIDREMETKFHSEPHMHQKWRRALSRALELQEYQAKDIVYFAGQEASCVIWIYSGSVSLFETDPLNGTTKFKGKILKSECFGFAPPFKLASKRKFKGKHTCIGARKIGTDARAEECVTVIRLSVDSIDELIEDYPLFDEVWTSQLQVATKRAAAEKLSQESLRKGSSTDAGNRRDKARAGSKARLGSAGDSHLWGTGMHASSRAANIERKHAPDQHIAKHIQKQVNSTHTVVWQIGDRVEVIKKASLLGHTGVVVDGDWQGRVKVRLDPVAHATDALSVACPTAARKRQSLMGDGVMVPVEETTIRSFLSNELIAFNKWDERQFAHKHKPTRSHSRRMTKHRLQAKMRQWQASDVVRVIKEGSQLGNRAQVLDGDWRGSGRVRVRMEHDGGIRSYVANEIELVAWTTSQKLWRLLEMKAAIVPEENKAFAEKHIRVDRSSVYNDPTDPTSAVYSAGAQADPAEAPASVTWKAGDRVQISKAGSNEGAAAVVVGWMCMGKDSTSATGGGHPKDRVLVKMEVSCNTKSYLPRELISCNSKEQAIGLASDAMFKAAADAADAVEWAENDIKGAIAFKKLHNEAKARPQKLAVAELQELLMYYLHFDVAAVMSSTKATLLSQLVPFRSALRINSTSLASAPAGRNSHCPHGGGALVPPLK
jgi:hypothetical protein